MNDSNPLMIKPIPEKITLCEGEMNTVKKIQIIQKEMHRGYTGYMFKHRSVTHEIICFN